MSNEEIGDQLAVTVGTIKGHLVSVYRKLKVRNRTGAVAKARQLGLLKQEATMSTTTRRQAVIDNQPDAPGYPAEDTRYPSARV
jgi:Bacterial regulatory proteins, luxR family